MFLDEHNLPTVLNQVVLCAYPGFCDPDVLLTLTKSFLLPKHVHILTMAVVAMSVVLHEKENIFAVDIVFFLQI